MKIKIGKIDLDGFLGRENHPEKIHEGLEGFVLSASSEAYIGATPIEESEILVSSKLPDFHFVTFFRVLLPSGEEVDVVDYEIAEVL